MKIRSKNVQNRIAEAMLPRGDTDFCSAYNFLEHTSLTSGDRGYRNQFLKRFARQRRWQNVFMHPDDRCSWIR